MEIDIIKDVVVQGSPKAPGDLMEVGRLLGEKLILRGFAKLTETGISKKSKHKSKGE